MASVLYGPQRRTSTPQQYVSPKTPQGIIKSNTQSQEESDASVVCSFNEPPSYVAQLL